MRLASTEIGRNLYDNVGYSITGWLHTYVTA
jgi:hypothetical protein